MKKPTLETVLATKKQPEPLPAPVKARPDDGKMTTSLRIEPGKLGRLKMLALRRRVRVNDIILRAIDDYLAVHEETNRAA